MIEARPGLDVSSLVEGVLGEERLHGRPFSSLFSSTIAGWISHPSANRFNLDAYSRLFAMPAGTQLANLIGNESKTLDIVSLLSLEVLAHSLSRRKDLGSLRLLSVPGPPESPPVLLALTPAMEDVVESRRITDELDLHPQSLFEAFAELRSDLRWEDLDPRMESLLRRPDPNFVAELLWIAQPEVVLSRRPKMMPLCSPSPHLAVRCGVNVSTAGALCRDADGELGITACYHGTGPPGTFVDVAGIRAVVKDSSEVQDIVFIPLGEQYAVPPLVARKGARSARAPSEAEPVVFEGAGSKRRVDTRVKSHDAGLLRKSRAMQLKVQTPADTNTGDSGAALIDDQDQIVGFGFERTGIGEFPELTDWIWAANALSALGLTPI